MTEEIANVLYEALELVVAAHVNPNDQCEAATKARAALALADTQEAKTTA